MGSDKINRQSEVDSSKWKKMNDADCGEINITPELCYPKSDVSPEVKHVLDIIYSYRENRHDDTCNPNPQDPCAISTLGMIKPDASPILKVEPPVYELIGNVEISVNCYDIFSKEVDGSVYYPNEAIDFDDYAAGQTRISDLKWQGSNGASTTNAYDNTKIVVSANSYVISIDTKDPDYANKKLQAQGQVNYYALVDAVSRLDCKVSAEVTVECPSHKEDGVELLNASESSSKIDINLGTYVAYSFDRNDETEYTNVVALSAFDETRGTQDNHKKYIEASDLETLTTEGIASKFDDIWFEPELKSWFAAGTLVSSLVADSAYSSLNCYYGNTPQTAYCVAPLYKGSDGHYYTNFATPRGAYIDLSKNNAPTKVSFFNNPDDALGTTGVSRSDFIRNLRPTTYTTWNNQNKTGETLIPLAFTDTSSHVRGMSSGDTDIDSLTLTPVDPDGHTVASPVSKFNTDSINGVNINTFLHQSLDTTTKESVGESYGPILANSYTSRASVTINYNPEDSDKPTIDEKYAYIVPTVEVDDAIDDADDSAFNEAAANIDCEYKNSLVNMNCPDGFTISAGVSSVSQDADTVDSMSSYNTAQSIATNIVFSQLSGCMAMSGAVEAFCDYKTMVEKIMVDNADKEWTFSDAQEYPWIIRADKIDNLTTPGFIWKDLRQQGIEIPYAGEKVYIYSKNYLIMYNGTIINNNIDGSTTTTVEYDTPFAYSSVEDITDPANLPYDHSDQDPDPDVTTIIDSYPCEYTLKIVDIPDQTTPLTERYTIQYEESYTAGITVGNCLVNKDASQPSYLVPQGTFTKTSNGTNTNDIDTTQSLTVKSMNLAIAGLLCQYGNSAIPKINCQYKVYNTLDEENITNSIFDNLEIKRVCAPVYNYQGCGQQTVGETTLNYCSVGTAPSGMDADSYNADSPYKSNKLALSLYLAGRVCLDCDIVGGGGGGGPSNININAGSCSCNNCSNAYCVFTS